MRLVAIPRYALTAIAVFFLLPVVAQAQIEITLKKFFIEKYKDRVTIDADFIVDKAHQQPNSPSRDCDIHVAGRSPEEIGQPIVAEIMNAAESTGTAGSRRVRFSACLHGLSSFEPAATWRHCRV